VGSWSEDWLVEGERRACMLMEGGFSGEVWGGGWVGFSCCGFEGVGGWGMWRSFAEVLRVTVVNYLEHFGL